MIQNLFCYLIILIMVIQEGLKLEDEHCNENIENAFLEFKHKVDEGGTKTKQSIFQYKNQINISSNKFKNFNIPIKINQDLVPILGVNYLRHYLLSKCGEIRITIDQNLEFGKIVRLKNNFNLNFNINFPAEILELKSDLSITSHNKSFSKILDYFNLTRSRFSKYCMGVKLLY